MFTGLAGILTASHAGGHWFESSSLHQEKPRNYAGYEVFSFSDFLAFVSNVLVTAFISVSGSRCV